MNTVLDHFKDQLPGPIAGQFDALMGGAGDGADLGGLAKGSGDLLGRK